MSPNRDTHTRRIVILTFPGFGPLDVAGPAEVFAAASTNVEGAYEVEVVAESAGPLVASGCGFGLMPTGTTSDCEGAIDTLLVAGGFGVGQAMQNDGLVQWVREAAARSRRVTSVCAGSILLAAAGLLDGRRATSHWAGCELMAKLYPEVDVDPEPIFVRDGHVWTSAGVSAGMDLALALVAEDLGKDVALEVARWLVLFVRRPGGQAQFSTDISGRPASQPHLRDLQVWIADNLDADLRVEALAERAGMSPRSFARAFRRETGQTPAAFVEALRVERARLRLERGAEPIESIAAACGFGTPETMRRAFARTLRISPREYRARFRRQPEPA